MALFRKKQPTPAEKINELSQQIDAFRMERQMYAMQLGEALYEATNTDEDLRALCPEVYKAIGDIDNHILNLNAEIQFINNRAVEEQLALEAAQSAAMAEAAAEQARQAKLLAEQQQQQYEAALNARMGNAQQLNAPAENTSAAQVTPIVANNESGPILSTCPSCGATLQPNDKFCMECGYRIEQ